MTTPFSTPKPNAGDEHSKIDVFCYNDSEFVEVSLADVQQVDSYLKTGKTVWINVDGCYTQEMLQSLAKLLNMHELAVEDVLNTHQRAKVDEYDDHMFIVMRSVNPTKFPRTEQLSIFLGEKYVVTIQEHSGGDCLSPVRERLRRNQGHIRKLGPDYLMYSIIDQVVDGYFPLIESLGERVEQIEDRILGNVSSRTAAQIHKLKREIQATRRSVWPLRDAINMLCRDVHPLIGDNTRVYMRDCYDHALRIIDLLETDRELCHDLMDIYLSTVNNRMNEVMKVLTIITSVFIPPTLIAGIYGMNFDRSSPFNMPELGWRYGYPLSLVLMVVLSGALLMYLHKRGWLVAKK